MVERINNYMQFLNDVRQEFSKVIWPTQSELVGTVLIVVILVVFFVLYVGAVDHMFSAIARWVY